MVASHLVEFVQVLPASGDALLITLLVHVRGPDVRHKLREPATPHMHPHLRTSRCSSAKARRHAASKAVSCAWGGPTGVCFTVDAPACSWKHTKQTCTLSQPSRQRGMHAEQLSHCDCRKGGNTGETHAHKGGDISTDFTHVHTEGRTHTEEGEIEIN